MADTLPFQDLCTQPGKPLFQDTCWWRPQGPVQGYAIAIHGLNTRPSVMDDWARALQAKGVATLRLGLAGHNTGKVEAFKEVNGAQWAKQAAQAVGHVAQVAKAQKVPWGLVGHSLGAVVGLHGVVQGDPQWQVPQWALFLAPALAVKPLPSVVRMFQFWPRLVVPSKGPISYRAVEQGTPVAAYKALFELKSEIDGLDVEEWHRLRPIKTNVVLDKKDELISFEGTEKWIDERGFLWPVKEVNGTAIQIDGKAIPKHLCVDQKTLGEKNWEMVLQLLYASCCAL